MSQENTPKKPRSLEARVAKGFIDRSAADIAATDAMMAKIREVYELYGFDAVETPFVEYTDCLGKFLPDQDRPNEGVFSVQDDDDQWLSLRYDLTAPLARYYAENHEKLPKPYRSYRAGWVFRNEKPGPGRFRQFMQFDADTVGSQSVAADAEICMMAADTLEALGIRRGDYVIKVNNRKVLDGVMEAAGVRDDQKLTVLRAIDKLDKFGWDGVQLLLGAGRKDESGDFTKGAGLTGQQINSLDLWMANRGNDPRAGTNAANDAASLDDRVIQDTTGAPYYPYSPRQLDMLLEHFGEHPTIREGLLELKQISDLCRAAGYGTLRLIVDMSVVRGLEYYTGPVFEAELTFEVKGEDGRPIRFGSVGGGGRYDGLVSRFLPEPAPATGFSIGVSRLLAALKAVNSPIVAGAKPPGPVVVLAMDKDPAAMAGYQKLVGTLRAAGIRAEMYLGSAGMKPQMKYADRRGSPCVIIQGSNEREQGVVQIKDLVMGASIISIKDRTEYLAAQAEAQFMVPTGDIIAGVRRVLDRYRKG